MKMLTYHSTLRRIWEYIILLLKIMIALIPLWLLWGYVALFSINYQNQTYTFLKWNKDFTNTTQEDVYDVVFLGDSYINAAIVPELLSDKTVNLAESGCSPVEAYYTLKEYMENNAAPSVCYVAFCNGIMNSTAYRDFYILFHRLNIEEMVEIMRNANFLMKNDRTAAENEAFVSYYNSIDFREWIKQLLYFPDQYMSYLYNSNFLERREDNLDWIAFMNRHRGVWVARSVSVDHTYDGITGSVWEYNVQPMMDLYFSKIVELCRENHMTLRVIDAPLPDYMSFSEEYKKEYLKYYQKYLEQYDDMTVAGFFQNLPSDLYCDGYHLNLHGGYEFSSMLREAYPEDFSFSDTMGDISEKASAGFADYLSMENRGEYILKWLDGKNFSIVVFFHETPEDSEMVNMLGKQYDYDCETPYFYLNGKKGIHADGIDIKRSCTADGKEGATNIKNVESITFVLPWGEEYTLDRISSERYIPDMQIIILDEYSNEIIATKNFIYNDGDYQLMK